MNTLNLVSAGAGLGIVVGAGLIYRGQTISGVIILVLGLLNLVQMVRLMKREKQ